MMDIVVQSFPASKLGPLIASFIGECLSSIPQIKCLGLVSWLLEAVAPPCNVCIQHDVADVDGI